MMAEARQLEPNAFPPLLHEMSDPPEQLWAVGSLPSLDFTWLTVVGSRAYTPYGKQVCEELIRGLRGQSIVIVSGLAIGIDSIAHRAALDVGLPTVAIPGSGLHEDVLYPRSNALLGRGIVENGGALLSELAPKQKAAPWTFPKRNRLMAGIAHATLVIEAATRSGTLITARLALEYNRDVLTVPHPIFSRSGTGANHLLRLGATPVCSSGEILDALGIPQADVQEHTKKALSEQEARVAALLREPRPRDEIIRALDMSAADAGTLLSAMELKGLIREELGVLRLAT